MNSRTRARQRHGGPYWRLFAVALIALVMAALSGCAEDTPDPGPTGPGTVDPGPGPTPTDPTDRPTGETDFVSADGSVGQETQENTGGTDTDGRAEPAAGDDSFSDEPRTVEEGDIYRVLEEGRILNLNAYRGLQIINIEDLEDPEIEGRLQVSGYPVELYVLDDVAFVLMNNWSGYYGSRTDVDVERLNGGVALAVDISDPTEPVVLDRAFIPGWVQTSRLTRGGGGAALYVVTGGYYEWVNEDGTRTWDSRTVVMSFDVSDYRLEKRSQLNLGGYVTDIQATTEALLVARNDWQSSESRNLLSIVDISDPHGSMVEGDQVPIAGYIQNQFNMDLYKGVLRVVSGGWWGGTATNHLQTFDASDIDNLAEIDHLTFGDGENLYATLFLGNKAFCVTYMRIDPFHAFHITDDGHATEMSEFVVSGWNDFFRPVLDETRLIGIGVNDESSRNMAVSLYDITDLTNPEPLVARAEVDASSGSWSEASWDHRAFSVLDGAVSVAGPDGVTETGLVLLPFSGWSSEDETYISAVQIFTYSSESLTRRGLMNHGTQVRRSFLAEEDVTANLSEAELSLFQTGVPDSPLELGRVELAPNYTDLLVYGDYGARVKDSREYYWSWWGGNAELPPTRIEIVSMDENPDTADALATIEVSANSQVYQAGDLLVAIDMTPIDTSDWPYTYHSVVDVFDLGDPLAPVFASRFETDELTPNYGYYYGPYDGPMVGDCFDCGRGGYYYGGYAENVYSTDHALVFLQAEPQQELLGMEESCYTSPSWESESYCYDTEDDTECFYYTGGISCRSLNDEEPVCSGSIWLCSYYEDGCVEVDPESVPTETYCNTYERYRYWQQYTLQVIDLSDPTALGLAEPLVMPDEDEGVSMLADGTSVFVSFRRPVEVDGDSRDYVRFFFRQIDLDDPAEPVVSDPINVPGRLLAVDGDDVFTLDTVYGEHIIDAAITRLQVFEGLAYLQARHSFPDQQIHNILLDGADHVLVSHKLSWQVGYDLGYQWDDPELRQHLTVLGAEDLDVLADVEVDDWASLNGAVAGRALFQVPGGLLVMNLDDPAAPFAQAFFATRGWPREINIEGRQIIFAAGRYGIYAFGLDTFNLLSVM